MADRKPTDYVQFKLRVRQSLVKRIQKEAAKKKHSANNEAVERLEQSFESDEKSRRDSQILDMLLGFTTANSDMKKLFHHISVELTTRPLELGSADVENIGLRFFELLEPYRQKHMAEKKRLKEKESQAAAPAEGTEGDEE
jgi:hypothetical protein